MRVIFSRGHLATSRDVFDDHKWGWGMWGEARDAGKHLTTLRTVPTIKSYLIQNVGSGDVRAPALG